MHRNATERLLINLRILSCVVFGDRLNTTGELLQIESLGWGVGLSRWWRGDTRAQCVRRLSHLIDECKTALDAKMKLGQPTLRLLQHLHAASLGLDHVHNTYEADIPISHQLSLLIERARGLLRSHGYRHEAGDGEGDEDDVD